MAQEVKYLSYSGLSYLKDKLEARYERIGHVHDYLPLAGGTMTGTITSQSIIPTTNTTYNLGSSSNQFNIVYTRYIDTVSGYNLRLRAAGVEHLNMIGGTVNSTANIIPTVNNTYNLGSSAFQWNNIYGRTLYENGTSLASKYAASAHTHTQFNNLTCFNKGIHISGGNEHGSTIPAIITFGDSSNEHIQDDINASDHYIETEYEPRVYIGEREDDLLTIRAPYISIGSMEYERESPSKINVEDGHIKLFVDISNYTEETIQPTIDFNIYSDNAPEYYSQIDINANKVRVNGNEVAPKDHTHGEMSDTDIDDMFDIEFGITF